MTVNCVVGALQLWLGTMMESASIQRQGVSSTRLQSLPGFQIMERIITLASISKATSNTISCIRMLRGPMVGRRFLSAICPTSVATTVFALRLLIRLGRPLPDALGSLSALHFPSCMVVLEVESGECYASKNDPMQFSN